MQQRSSSQHHYAYKRQPTQQIYTSTFNPYLPSGHTSSIKQYEGNPYATATAVLDKDQPEVAVTPSETPKSTSPLSNFNLSSLTKYANVDEIKGLVDRFGGLDGILATVTKVQKVMSTVGQIAPMAKVFTGILGNKKTSSDNNSNQQSTYVPARRRSTPKRNQVKEKGRKVQVTKRSTTRTKRSQVYTTPKK